ncbi:MAG: FHA domain-containing protein, partial [Hyphomicrobiaceae bacterium]
MPDEKGRDPPGRGSTKFLGSLREALAAAGREDPTRGRGAQPASAADAEPPKAIAGPPPLAARRDRDDAAGKDIKAPSAAEAAMEARGGAPTVPPVELHVENDPTARVLRAAKAKPPGDSSAHTQLLRGKQPVKRGNFHQDPVVG